MRKFLPLDERLQPGEVGAKASNLGILASIAQVPPGFVVQSSWFLRFLEVNKARNWIGRLHGHPELIDIRAVQREMMVAPVSPGIIAATTEALALLGASNLVVRSSTNFEDDREGSAAGLFKSLIGVEARSHEVVAAIREIWASQFSPEALTYCSSRSLDISRATMSVIVQQLPSPVYSGGVAFSHNPVQPNENVRVIEAVLGLAFPLVSGLVQPDHYRLSAAGVEREIVRKHIALWVQPGLKSFLPGDMVTLEGQRGLFTAIFYKYLRGDVALIRPLRPFDHITTLSEHELAQLENLLEHTKKLYLSGVDLEWISTPQGIQLVQARPITTALASRQSVTSARIKGEPLKGTPVAAGQARGRLFGEDHPDPSDAILVLYDIQPSHLPLIRRAAGVTVERGGLLSHGAILCRELGKPCLRLPGLHSQLRLHTGRNATLDANGGNLWIH